MTTAHAFAYDTDSGVSDETLDPVEESAGTFGRAAPGMTEMAEAPLADLAPLKPAHNAAAVLAEDGETALTALVPRLRSRDGQLAATLLNIVTDLAVAGSERAMAIEVLAAARVPAFEPYVVNCILRSLDCDDEDVRFAAVAAVSDISSWGRVAFRRRLRELASEEEPSSSVRRAAQALLRTSAERGR